MQKYISESINVSMDICTYIFISLISKPSKHPQGRLVPVLSYIITTKISHPSITRILSQFTAKSEWDFPIQWKTLEIYLNCSKELILETPIIKQYRKRRSASCWISAALWFGRKPSARDDHNNDNNDIQVNSITSSAVLLFVNDFIQELHKLKFKVKI